MPEWRNGRRARLKIVSRKGCGFKSHLRHNLITSSYKKPKVIVIVGPTASGKTGLAIEIAKRFAGEVISADSRQVYRGMDIGSAKVTKEEMQGISHHLLDVVDPTEVYTAADFKQDGEKALNDILGRNKLPIIAGGTFFYIDSLLGKVALPEVEPNPELRARLEKKSAADLFMQLQNLDPERAVNIDPENKRRLIRAIEIADKLGQVPALQTKDMSYDVLTIGLNADMTTHGEVIKQRLVERLDKGMIAEVENLLAKGVTHERLEDFGLEYRYVSYYLQGKLSYDQMVEELAIKIRQFAKRQMTWLKRDESIHWFEKDDQEVFVLVDHFLKS